MAASRGVRGDSGGAGLPGLAIVPIQPMPKTWRIATRTVDGVSMTAIQRSWEWPDGPMCRLCPRSECNYDRDDGSCLVMVDGIVPDDRAALFSTFGLVRGAGVPLVKPG